MLSFKTSSEDRYNLLINGRTMPLNASQVGKIIKNILKKSIPVQKMFAKFDVALDRLNDLQIQIVPLDKKYALTDDKVMKINSSLLKDENFFEKYMFVFVHEVVHFLTRLSEKKSFFNDTEEQEGFILSIAHYLSVGKSIQDIQKEIFPTIEFHFNDPSDASIFFKRMVLKAKKLLQN